MIVTQKSKIVVENIYSCASCGKKSDHSYDIQMCELKHRQDNCAHDVDSYEVRVVDRDWGTEAHVEIARSCGKCNLIKTVLTMPDKLNQDDSKKLFGLIEVMKSS